MNRRQLLGTVAGTLIGGCLSVPTDGGGVTQSAQDTATRPVDPGASSSATQSTPGPKETPVLSFAIGEERGDINPLGVSVQNQGAEARTIVLRITAVDRDERLVDRRVSLPPGARIDGTIKTPATYEIRLAVPMLETSEVTIVERELFDSCNSYGYRATIGSEGTIEATRVTTLLKCITHTTTNADSATESA